METPLQGNPQISSSKAAAAKTEPAEPTVEEIIAQQAAKALGATPEQVAALESVVGYDKVMEMFRSIGSKIGEDKLFTGNNDA